MLPVLSQLIFSIHWMVWGGSRDLNFEAFWVPGASIFMVLGSLGSLPGPTADQVRLFIDYLRFWDPNRRPKFVKIDLDAVPESIFVEKT